MLSTLNSVGDIGNFFASIKYDNDCWSYKEFDGLLASSEIKNLENKYIELIIAKSRTEEELKGFLGDWETEQDGSNKYFCFLGEVKVHITLEQMQQIRNNVKSIS